MTRTDDVNDGRPGEAVPSACCEEHLEAVDAAVVAVARRCRLTSWEAEELRSETWLKLVKTGGLAFRRFRRESRLHTYLTAIARNVLRDQRDKEWGKWRSSSSARQLGPMGIAVERLLNRDRKPLEAIAKLVTNGLEAGGAALFEIVDALPVRRVRRTVGAEILDTMSSQDPSPLELMCRTERRTTRLRAIRAVNRALSDLTERERGLIAWRYLGGRTIAAHARVTGLDQKGSYRECTRILKRLRTGVEREGIHGLDVRDAFLADQRQ